jgi:hypothetical protein
MAKVVDITNRLSNVKPCIAVGDKQYIVNDGMDVVLKFQELQQSGNMMQAIELTLGKDAVKELDVEHMSIGNFKVLVIAILAAAQDTSYEEAESRFQKAL